MNIVSLNLWTVLVGVWCFGALVTWGTCAWKKLMSHSEPHAREGAASSWLFNILVALDELGNALADGDPHHTVSATVGYYAHQREHDGKRHRYWKTLESLIDSAMNSQCNAGHCFGAWQYEQYKIEPPSAPQLWLLFHAFLFIGVLVVCPFLGLFVRLRSWISRPEFDEEETYRAIYKSR